MSVTHLSRGSAGYRRATLALFCAGFATFAMLYCVQPLLPLLAAHFRVSAASSSLALSLTTLSLALCLLVSGALAESWGRKPVMVAALGLAMRDVIDVQDGEELLSDLRVLKGMTQPELAAEAGLATSTLAGLEQGHLRLRNIHIQGLSRALDLPEDVVASAYARTRSRPL